jgi:hypothetical protein
MIAMARAAVQESHDPLTVIIANLEAVISDLHPGHYAYDRLAQMRDAAWTIARRLKGLTEVRDAGDVGSVAVAGRPPLCDLTR